jgi:hypothetical protein
VSPLSFGAWTTRAHESAATVTDGLRAVSQFVGGSAVGYFCGLAIAR